MFGLPDFEMPSLEEIKIGAALFGALVIAAGATWTTHRVDMAQYDDLKLSYAQAQLTAEQKARAEQLQLDQVSNDATARELDAERSMRASLQARLTGLAKRVGHKNGCITWAVLREHDAKVKKIDPETLPFPDGVTGETCAPITWDALLTIVVSNYDVAQRLAEKDKAWQDWALQIAGVKR